MTSVWVCRLWPELRRPHRWRKCKQTAKNNTFYPNQCHQPLITQLTLNYLYSMEIFIDSVINLWLLNILRILFSIFSIRTFNASVNLCRELGIRHAEELSLSKPLEQEHLKENYQQTVMRRKPVPPTKEGNTGIFLQQLF